MAHEAASHAHAPRGAGSANAAARTSSAENPFNRESFGRPADVVRAMRGFVP